MNHSHHNLKQMAIGATLHCLTGCAIGEVLGLVIGTSLNLDTILIFLLSIGLAFLFGFLLSAMVLIRAGMTLGAALKVVVAADTLSITVMEIVDNSVMALIPGAMDAGLSNPLFWVSMPISLAVAFVAAYPVNLYLLQRGKGHALTMSHGEEHSHSIVSSETKWLLVGLTSFFTIGFIASIVIAITT